VHQLEKILRIMNITKLMAAYRNMNAGINMVKLVMADSRISTG
jgi:hypothetical protein